MDDAGHPSLRAKGRWRRRPPPFFTVRERLVGVGLLLVFVGLTVLSITGHIG